MRSTVPAYAELEIDLARVGARAYQVELRFTDPEQPRGEAERDEGEKPRVRAAAALEPLELLALQQNSEAYGTALAEQLLSDPEVGKLWARAHAVAEFLRVRLHIDPSAAELLALRWELLIDPETKAPLATSEKTPFSRFMVSRDWRPVRLRPKADLKALVAVAAPSNLERYKLADVDLKGEIDRATAALSGIEVDVAGRDEPLTLERLIRRLRAGNGRRGVDVLYLVCHGAQVRGVPRLFLQDESGEVQVEGGDELARRIAELQQAPRLVVLASCESAAPPRSDGAAKGVFADESTAEAALAPRLAEAGVPAILAMQGRVSMATIEKAMPVFFRELLEDGQIDRAMAVARGIVRERPDAWMPALFLRLKRGRIWYVPGFAGEGEDFAKWRSLCRHVRQGQFIPFLGLDVGEHVFGGSRELAELIATANGFPLARHDRSDLAKVTQYLSISQDRDYAQKEILKYLHKQTLNRHRDVLDDGARDLPLPALFDAVSDHLRRDESDPLRILAELRAAVYVTASPETLLYKSLQKAGKEPALLACDWRPIEENVPTEPIYEGTPTPERPIVYHVFGVFGKPRSLVMTEDDFFDYLISTSEYKLIPNQVRGKMTECSLLFLGFRLDDWTFRLLFRMIMSLEGCAGLRQYSHVGVQVDPEEHDWTDVERARKYLDGYFSADRSAGSRRAEPRIDIYWGTAANFLDELRVQLDKTADGTQMFKVEMEEGGGWF